MRGYDYSNTVHFAWEPCPGKTTTGMHVWREYRIQDSTLSIVVECLVCDLVARFRRLELDRYEVLLSERASARRREPKSGRQ